MGLAVREWMLGRALGSGEAGSGRSVHLAGYARLALLFLRRRGKTWPALGGASCHDALEQVGRTVPDGGRRGLRRTDPGALGRTGALLEFVAEAGDFIFIPAMASAGHVPRACDSLSERGSSSLCFHGGVGLLELVDLAPHEFHLGDLVVN